MTESSMPRSRLSICYKNSAEFPPEVAEALENFSLKRDGSVTTSDLLAGAHALEQLRSLNRFMKLVIGMLSVVVLILVAGSFGSTMWAISLSKETAVLGHVLVTPGGDAVRVMSNEFAIDETGQMVTRAQPGQSGGGTAVAAFKGAKHYESFMVVNGSRWRGLGAVDRTEGCHLFDAFAGGVQSSALVDLGPGIGGPVSYVYTTLDSAAAEGGPCDSSDSDRPRGRVSVAGRAGVWNWRLECEAERAAGTAGERCMIQYVVPNGIEGGQGTPEEGGRRMAGRGRLDAKFKKNNACSLDPTFFAKSGECKKYGAR
jgi:hypothetical protein